MSDLIDPKRLLKTIAALFMVGYLVFLRPCPFLDVDKNMMKLHFISMGYADALFLETPGGEHLLIDAGSAKGAGRLTAYLQKRNISQFTAVILTHPHENHFGGLPAVFEKYPVQQFFINGDENKPQEGYRQVIQSAQAHQLLTKTLKEGDALEWENGRVHLSVLHPSGFEGSLNENALVLWVVYGGTSFLLTSDIQPQQQEDLIKRYPQVKQADVVQVPHHGGKLADAFAQFFKGDTLFVVSTGPSPYEKPFMEELDKLRGTILRTDLNGTIVFQSDGTRVEVADE